MKLYQPMKLPSKPITIDDLPIKIPDIQNYAMSEKLDGIRVEIQDGKVFSKSQKYCPNLYLLHYFHVLIEYSKLTPEYRYIGELYSPIIPFGEIFSYWSSHMKDIALKDTLKLHLFDCVDMAKMHTPYYKRQNDLSSMFSNILEDKLEYALINWVSCINYTQTTEAFDHIIAKGGEGLVLMDQLAPYKCKRLTEREAVGFKLKAWQQESIAKIVGVIQGTKVNEDAEKSINELGYSVTSKKKEDRLAINQAASFLCENTDLDGHEVLFRVSLTSLPVTQRQDIWNNKEKYIDKKCYYKSMACGVKDRPRIASFTSFID